MLVRVQQGFFLISEYGVVSMKIVVLQCGFCDEPFEKESKVFDFYRKQGQLEFFCSKECRYKGIGARKGSVISKCANCQKDIPCTRSRSRQSKFGNNFCSRSCAASLNNTRKVGVNNPNYINGVSTYRKQQGIICEECGEDRYYLLMVHHIDGDRSNPSINNLSTLCYNCHVLQHLRKVDERLVVDFRIITNESVRKELGIK